MLVKATPEKEEEIGKLRREAHELTLIFQKITMSLKQHEVVVEN